MATLAALEVVGILAEHYRNHRREGIHLVVDLRRVVGILLVVLQQVADILVVVLHEGYIQGVVLHEGCILEVVVLLEVVPDQVENLDVDLRHYCLDYKLVLSSMLTHLSLDLKVPLNQDMN